MADFSESYVDKIKPIKDTCLSILCMLYKTNVKKGIKKFISCHSSFISKQERIVHRSGEEKKIYIYVTGGMDPSGGMD